MKTTICVAAACIALMGVAGTAHAAGEDCDAMPPRVETPGSTTEVIPGGATNDTLTEKLATCGSVLTPPPLGDADIVAPTPPVGDDMNIHPDAPAPHP